MAAPSRACRLQSQHNVNATNENDRSRQSSGDATPVSAPAADSLAACLRGKLRCYRHDQQQFVEQQLIVFKQFLFVQFLQHDHTKQFHDGDG